MTTRAVKVLTVDDDRKITKLIRVNLASEDIEVVEANSGLECLQRICSERPDLVLLDLHLPDFNGWGILGLLKSTSTLSRIPVIVISVEPPSAQVGPFSPDDFIQKPFDARELLVRVRRLTLGYSGTSGE